MTRMLTTVNVSLPSDDEPNEHGTNVLVGIRRAVLEGDIDRALKLTKFYYPHVLERNGQVYFRLRCRKFVEMIRKEAELNLVGGSGSGGISGIGTVTNGSGKQSNGRGHTDSHHSQQDMDVDDIDMVEDGTDEPPPSQSVVDEAIAYGQALQSEYIHDPRSEVRGALGEIFSLLAYTNPLKEKGVAHLMDQRGRVAVAEELNSAILRMHTLSTSFFSFSLFPPSSQADSDSRISRQVITCGSGEPVRPDQRSAGRHPAGRRAGLVCHHPGGRRSGPLVVQLLSDLSDLSFSWMATPRIFTLSAVWQTRMPLNISAIILIQQTRLVGVPILHRSRVRWVHFSSHRSR